MSPPTIAIHEIPEEGLDLTLPLDAAWVRGALEGTEYQPAGDPAGEARLRLDLRGTDVLLQGTVRVRLQAPCVRCLETTAFPVEASLVLNLEPRPATVPHVAGAVEEHELSADELDRDYYDADRVDLSQWIREHILLEAPGHPTCENPCNPPVVPGASTTSEIDPRLAPLKRLLTNKE